MDSLEARGLGFFELSEKEESDILLLCEVASANGSALSLSEIMHLASIQATEQEISEAWKNSPVLRSSYTILDSGLVSKSGISHEGVEQEEERRRERARQNIKFSENIEPLLCGKEVLALSVSGSTSYFSVSESDDLDFFTITKRGGVWLFLSRSLLLLRAKSFFSHDLAPPVCLGYTGDEVFARSEFLTCKSGLFARDALTALPIFGAPYYEELLKEASWIGRFFPKAYAERIAKYSGGKFTQTLNPKRRREPPSFLVIANMFLYLSVGTYLRLKSALLNRRFAKKGEFDRIFKVRLGIDHCIYEARSYVELRKMYKDSEYGHLIKNSSST